MENQIKSKKRVKDLGEVYTNRREVESMLDLIGEITYNISAKNLEPACGNGNFLEPILERKIKTVFEIYNKNKNIREFEINILNALSSIYGIDIDLSNVLESRQRLLNYVKKTISDIECDSVKVLKVSEYILGKNIIKADFLKEQDKIFFSDFTIKNDLDFDEIVYSYHEIG